MKPKVEFCVAILKNVSVNWFVSSMVLQPRQHDSVYVIAEEVACVLGQLDRILQPLGHFILVPVSYLFNAENCERFSATERFLPPDWNQASHMSSTVIESSLLWWNAFSRRAL